MSRELYFCFEDQDSADAEALIGRVIADNEPARKLCQLMGWREVGIHERHGKLGSDWHDLALVEFQIPENMK